MGMTDDFSTFVFSPVASSNLARISASVVTSLLYGLTKIAMLSAYMDVRMTVCFPLNFAKCPSSVARSRIFCSGSIAMTNSRGERGSPWRNPQSCLIGVVGTPLRRIWEDDDDRRAATQSLHFGGKPSLLIRVSRYSHRNESNALVMSSLKNRDAVLDLWNRRTAHQTDMKLSWMLLFFIKALKLLETDGSCEAPGALPRPLQ